MKKRLLNQEIFDLYDDYVHSKIDRRSSIVQDFQNHPIDSKILVLGDMYELGDYTMKEHERILQFIEIHAYKAVLLIGENYAKCEHRSHFRYFKNSTLAKEWLQQQAFGNCYFLAKASRGIRIETIFQ